MCLAKSFGVEGFQKVVAIKTILPHISEDENFVKMFIDEAKIAARLQHSNICQIFDFGKISDDFGDHLYQVMEYIPGFSLKHMEKTFWERKEPIPVPAALHIVARVCEGLDYAHALPDRDGRPLGIVHRDVTPANILISIEGAVKLIDFGIAKAAQRETKTQAGIVKGKFGYMTPEQLQGKELDGRSDIFSLGVVLWELLANRILFNEPNELDNLRKILNGDYPHILDVRPDLPAEIGEVAMKALAHNRDERYQTAEEFAQDLNRVAFRTKNFWNTTSLEKFIAEFFPKEVQAEQEKRSKYANIRKEDFMKFPSLTEVGRQKAEDAEELDAGELVEAEEYEEEEADEDRTVVSRVPAKKSPAIQGRIAKSGSDEKTPPVQRPDVAKSNFSGSLDLDAPRRGQSMEFPTLTEEKPKPNLETAAPFNPRATGVPSGSFAPVTSPVPEYPAYVSPYGESGAAHNSFIHEPSFPDDSFVDETSAYRPGADSGAMPSDPGYYGEDGQWYPYGQPGAPQGYYGEDGQWYPYAPGNPPQGYYGEDGQWHPYAPGNQPQGYYGEDGQWHAYPNPYYSGAPSYPDYSYPDNSSPDLSESNAPPPPKPRRR